jgi:hypothetical protein
MTNNNGSRYIELRPNWSQFDLTVEHNSVYCWLYSKPNREEIAAPSKIKSSGKPIEFR